MKKFVAFFMLITFVVSCEKDDICPDGTPTTAQLVVRFYDANIPDDLKTVSNLALYALDDLDQAVFFESIESRDSIAIPLRTDTNITRLVFHKDLLDLGDLTAGNPDNVAINYTREDVYVSRACGFKTIFDLQNTNITTDADNWISSIEIINENSTIENENSAHIKVFH